MPSGLRRFHESRQSHFATFSCYHRQPKFASADTYDLFVHTLEDMRVRFDMRIYGYVVMPEHVHLLVSEPDIGSLADAMHYLKLSFAKRIRGRREDLLALLATLDQQVGKLDLAVKHAAEANPQAKLLLTQPGVGPNTALAFVLTIGEVSRFQRGKQVASYLGLIPREESSGGRRPAVFR